MSISQNTSILRENSKKSCLDFYKILLVFSVLKLDHSLKSYEHSDFGRFWPNLKLFSKLSTPTKDTEKRPDSIS